MLRTTITSALTVAALTSGILAAPTPALAAGSALGPVNVHCGWVTCSLYFSRHTTKQMVTPYGAAAAIASVCPGPVCKALAASSAIIAVKANEAAGKNQCLRIRYERFTWKPVGLYSDGGKHCPE